MDPSEPPESTPPATGPSSLLRRRRVFLGLLAAALVFAAGGVAGSAWVKSPAQLVADHGPPEASELTAPVTLQVLAQTVVTRGTVVAGKEILVAPRAAEGTTALVITAEPKKAGAPVTAGDVVIQVSGRPVIALPGSIPAYRDLKPGDTGDDIAELQRALRSLGHPDHDRSGVFGAGTKAAVGRLYADIGYDPATTGGPGDTGDKAALKAAAQAVTSAGRALTAARQALSALPAGTGAAARTTARQDVRYAQDDLDNAEQAQRDLIATTGVDLPMSEFVFVPTLPAILVGVNGPIGATVTGTAATLSSGDLAVKATLQHGDGEVVKPGMSVQLLADNLGKTAAGVVSARGEYSTGTTAQQPGGTDIQAAAGSDPAAQAGFPLTVTPRQRLDHSWLGQDVRLTIAAASTGKPVLVVPVAAVSTAADGTTVLTATDAGRERRVVVTAGFMANGFVQVTPAEPGTLKAGDDVVTGQ